MDMRMGGKQSEMPTPVTARSITDSPGFWLLLFCGFGFCLMWIMHDRIVERLAEKSQSYTAMKASRADGKPETTPATQADGNKNEQVPSLQILFFVMASGALIGLVLLIRDIIRQSKIFNKSETLP
jgi:hypothetical protein